MSVSSLASAAVASQQGQLAQAMQTAMLKAGNEQEKAIVDMVTSSGIQTMAHHGMKRWCTAVSGSSVAYTSNIMGTSTE